MENLRSVHLVEAMIGYPVQAEEVRPVPTIDPLPEPLELTEPTAVVWVDVRHVMEQEGRVTILVWLRGPNGRKWVTMFGGGGPTGEHVLASAMTLEFDGSGQYVMELVDAMAERTVWTAELNVNLA